MIEFGAKLSLKDNMAATLQKNLELQRKFTQQIAQTNASVRELGKTKVNTSINATDNASGVLGVVKDGVEKVKQSFLSVGSVKIAPKAEIDDQATAQADKIANKIKEIGRFVASPVVKLKDLISSEAGRISKKLKEIATTYTPIVRLRDAASQGLAKIKNTLGWLGRAVAYPVLSLKDMATTGINKVRVALATVGKLVVKPAIAIKDTATKAIEKVKSGLKTVGKTVAKPFIQIKDKASPIINKVQSGLKAIGKTTARAALAIKDGASKVISKVKDGLKGVGSTVAKATVAIKDAASAGLDKIKSTLATLAKGVTIAVGIAGAGTFASLMEGAKLEQSIGGVETLFKGDAAAVKANADAAFRTAGLSANAYMETVTGFSASLLQSLKGDTAKAAKIADMAVIDMSDNANKFGTDMASIQNAYQGFAKQNYTMLDNLKLGYGGTKEEMQRLLVEAGKLSGQTYDISSLSDVYNAIHVIQENLGVTGTTAKEAAETFSGSFAAMKASAQNLLGNLAIGGDVTGSMEALVDTAATFIGGNLIPMVVNIFTALPDAIRVGLSNAAPKIKSMLQNVLPPDVFDGIMGAFDVVKNIVTTFKPVVQQLGAMFTSVAPKIADALSGAFGDGSGIIQGFADAISMAIPTIGNLLEGVAQVVAAIAPVLGSLGNMFLEVFPSILGVIDAVIPAILPILESLGTVIQTLIPVVSQIIQTFAGIIQQVFPIVSEVITMVLNAVMPIIEAFAGLIQQALPVVQSIIEIVVGVIQTIFPIVSQIFQEVGAKIAEVINTVITPVMGILQQVFQTVAPIIQTAIQVISSVFQVAWSIISPILDLVISIFQALLSVVQKVFPTIQNIISKVWSVLQPILNALSSALSAVGGAISKVGGWLSSGFNTVKGWLGFAYGKDRVPYNNYPAILHEGEKVLTRNQADQYDRAMSTRGVELSPSIKPLEIDTSTPETPKAIQEISGEKQENNGSNTKIEKLYLAETLIIEKEADTDKVVQDMVTKFRKLVPNMA